MADKFGFEKLSKDYFDTVFKKLDPKMSSGDAKPFSELLNLFGVIADIEEPQYEAMRHDLDLAAKTISKLLGHKAVKGTPIQNALKQLATGVLKAKAAVAREEKLYEKQGSTDGLIEVDISVSARDFYNDQVGGAKLELAVDSNPSPVKLSQMTSQGSARFRGVMIEPSGNVFVSLTLRREVHPKLSQNLGYKNVGSSKTLILDATEEAVSVEMSALSGRKVLDSKGVKGSVGIDFKIFKGSTELTSSKSIEESSQEAVKYVVYYPKGTLNLKQG
jgi:hypothetical protein